MERYAISDRAWEALAPLLPGRPGTSGRRARDNRLGRADARPLDAVVWIARNGGPWRDLPERFGPWNSAWRRFDRWSKAGVWLRLFEAAQDADPTHRRWVGEWVMLDSTTVRAHGRLADRPHAAGARKGGRAPAQGIRATSQPRARASAEAAVA